MLCLSLKPQHLAVLWWTSCFGYVYSLGGIFGNLYEIKSFEGSQIKLLPLGLGLWNLSKWVCWKQSEEEKKKRPFVLGEIKQEESEGQLKTAQRQICHFKPAVAFLWMKSSPISVNCCFLGVRHWSVLRVSCICKSEWEAEERASRGSKKNWREWPVKQLPLSVIITEMVLWRNCCIYADSSGQVWVRADAGHQVGGSSTFAMTASPAFVCMTPLF